MGEVIKMWFELLAFAPSILLPVAAVVLAVITDRPGTRQWCEDDNFEVK